MVGVGVSVKADLRPRATRMKVLVIVIARLSAYGSTYRRRE